MVVMAEDSSGNISATPITMTVTSQSQTTISGIQNMTGWQSCSADFPRDLNVQDNSVPLETPTFPLRL